MDSATIGNGLPGTLYDGDGTRLAGSGPELTLEMTEALPHKALIHDEPGAVDVAMLEAGDRLWLLPDSFGTPPVLPVLLLTNLAHVVRRGHKVGLAASDEDAYVLARDALMLLLDDSGGRA
ncbi:MAG: hypothetical protein JO157_16650 [Acetobacteraceae bacterium]|nr:hypothetical protein [Acetobacteraceae bacterium]